MRTLVAGGWSGTGLWLGARKNALPEAHTDYIFSVIGEEFGLISCAVVVILYCAIVLRAAAPGGRGRPVHRAGGDRPGRATRGQAFINILVNLQLFPSKG
jgi:cell division protein FtsW